MKHIIKKADIVLFFILILLGGILTVSSLVNSTDNTHVLVKAEGKVYGTYSLKDNQTITIDVNGHHNVLVINDGKVRMLEADCHNQLCVKQGAISKGNRAIVCLPNKIVVEIIGGEEDYDVISG